MNPYETPTTVDSQLAADHGVHSRFGPGLIAACLVLAVLAGVLSQVFPSIRSFVMPRFGWVGLILCLNPLIFLAPWLRSPTQPALSATALMMLAIGLINAFQLLLMGTVSVVENEFTDRLHSSWLWSVVPFFLASGYLYWRVVRMGGRVPAEVGPAANKPT